ncbi:hypothetical protein ACQ4PT_007935 [Festuca glaucescens]
MATPTVVLLPVWGVGHLMSMLDTGKRLLARSGGSLSLTVLVMQAPTESYRSDVAGHAAISRLTCPVAALVIDFFGTTLLDTPRELAVPSYVYFTASAAMYALFLRLPALHEEVTVEFEEMEDMVDVPGLPPVPPPVLPSPMMDKKKPGYTWFVYHGRRFMEARGVIINTASELEQSVLAAIADGRCTHGVPAPTVYPIGPVVSLNPPAEQPHECVRWLDKQPLASVVLLCFGGGGFSTATQAHEIAHGLERSGHRFLWVLRGPPAAGTRQPTDANLVELLPEGFLERTNEKGMVWPTRAPHPRRRGGLRDARRVELHPGEPVS